MCGAVGNVKEETRGGGGRRHPLPLVLSWSVSPAAWRLALAHVSPESRVVETEC